MSLWVGTPVHPYPARDLQDWSGEEPYSLLCNKADARARGWITQLTLPTLSSCWLDLKWHCHLPERTTSTFHSQLSNCKKREGDKEKFIFLSIIVIYADRCVSLYGCNCVLLDLNLPYKDIEVPMHLEDVQVL